MRRAWPRHQQKSRPSIRRTTAGGWPSRPHRPTLAPAPGRLLTRLAGRPRSCSAPPRSGGGMGEVYPQQRGPHGSTSQAVASPRPPPAAPPSASALRLHPPMQLLAGNAAKARARPSPGVTAPARALCGCPHPRERPVRRLPPPAPRGELHPDVARPRVWRGRPADSVAAPRREVLAETTYSGSHRCAAPCRPRGGQMRHSI